MEKFRSNNEVLTVERVSRLKRKFRISDDRRSIEISFPGKPEGLLTESGGKYQIDSSGILGKKWVLSGGSGEKATAERKGLRSAIEIDFDGQHFELSRKHLLSSEFELTSEEIVIAFVGKPKLVSGESEIQIFHADFDLLLYAFIFWVCENVRQHTTNTW